MPDRTAPTEPSQPLVPPPFTGTVKVALLLPLSGPNGAIGQAMQRAAELALFEVAAESFELLPFDTGGVPDGARRAAQQAVTAGARLILGPVFAPSVGAVKPIAAQAGVPVVAFSTDWTQAGNGAWLLGFTPFGQVERVASYAATQGYRQIAALLPQGPYGDAVETALRQAGASGTVQLTRLDRYGPADDLAAKIRALSDYDARRQRLEQMQAQISASGASVTAGSSSDDVLRQRALERLAAEGAGGDLPFQALVLAEGGAKLSGLAALLPVYDVDPRRVKLLGTGLWDDPTIGREQAMLGAWFAAPAPTLRIDFERRYRALYGADPPRIATLAYDATALAAVLARSGPGGGPNFTPAALTNPNGFAGIDGIFRLRPDGLTDRGLAVLEVQRNGAYVIDAPARSFAAPAF